MECEPEPVLWVRLLQRCVNKRGEACLQLHFSQMITDRTCPTVIVDTDGRDSIILCRFMAAFRKIGFCRFRMLTSKTLQVFYNPAQLEPFNSLEIARDVINRTNSYGFVLIETRDPYITRKKMRRGQ